MATNGGTSTSIDLSDSWGSTLAAVFVALVFYGVSILQTWVTRAVLQRHCSSSVPAGSFTTSGESRCESCTLSDVLMRISWTEDTIILKLLVGYHVTTFLQRIYLFNLLGGLGVRFRHAPYNPYICRR